MKSMLCVGLICIALAGAACGGGGAIIPNPQPQEAPIVAVSAAAGTARIYGESGSVDSWSVVTVISGGTGSGAAESTGDFSFDATLDQAAPSQVTVLGVQFIKDSVQLVAQVPLTKLSDRVTKPLFSTGGGPNDMVLAEDSLYIANTLDNNVTRYSLTGDLLDQVSFGEGTSPSYLAVSDGILVVTTNGSHEIIGFDADALADPPLFFYQAQAGEPIAFPGFGQPVIQDGICVVTTAAIESFSPAVYGEPERWVIDFNADYALTIQSILPFGTQLEVRNVQFGCWSDYWDQFIFAATGEIQFDESWQPYATSDSYLLKYHQDSPAGLAASQSDSPIYWDYVNLGPIGAGRIATTFEDAYIGNSLNGTMFKTHISSGTGLWQIVLTEEFTYVSDVAITPGGRYVLATSFNTDELYIVDTSAFDVINPGPYPAPFDLSLDPELLAGCANVEINPTPRADGGYDAYVLYGVANAVAKVELF